MADSRIVTATIGIEPYETSLSNGVHLIYSDEPNEIGGQNKGPTPQDFLRMSLASCTAITLRMYANRKELNVEKVIVEIRSETVEGKTIFHRNVFVKGTITNEQRERLLKIANACPVHKILTNPIEVNTTISI
jgi:putative redox protein